MATKDWSDPKDLSDTDEVLMMGDRRKVALAKTNLSGNLQTLILQATEFHPQKRIPDAWTLRNALEQV